MTPTTTAMAVGRLPPGPAARAGPAGLLDVNRLTCVRGTSYIVPARRRSRHRQVTNYIAQGFELGVACQHAVRRATQQSESLQTFYKHAARHRFATAFPTKCRTPATNRTHCIAWSNLIKDTNHGRAGHHGIRLRHQLLLLAGPSGFSIRSGHVHRLGPCRCVLPSTTGAMIDVYQAASQLTDKSGMSVCVPRDRSSTAHSGRREATTAPSRRTCTRDFNPFGRARPDTDAIIASAQARKRAGDRGQANASTGSTAATARRSRTSRGPTTSCRSAWRWGRARTGCRRWSPPARRATRRLATLSRNGTPVTYAVQVVKGVEYAAFVAEPGYLPGDVCARRRRPGHFRRLRERQLRRHRHHPVADQRERHHGDAVRHRSREPEPDRLRAQLPDQPQPRPHRTDRGHDVPLQGRVRGSVGEQRVVGGPQLRGHRRHAWPRWSTWCVPTAANGCSWELPTSCSGRPRTTSPSPAWTSPSLRMAAPASPRSPSARGCRARRTPAPGWLPVR